MDIHPFQCKKCSTEFELRAGPTKSELKSQDDFQTRRNEEMGKFSHALNHHERTCDGEVVYNKAKHIILD